MFALPSPRVRLVRPDRAELRVESSGLLVDVTGEYPALARQPFFAGMQRFLVFELLVHHLDTLTFLFGEVEILAAKLKRRCPAILGEDYAEIDLVAGSTRVGLVADFCVPGASPLPRDRLAIADELTVNGWDLHIRGVAEQRFDPVSGYQDSYNATLDHFVQAILKESPFATSVAAARKVLEHVDRIYELAHWNDY